MDPCGESHPGAEVNKTFSGKSQTVYILGFVGHMASAAPQLCMPL